MKNVFLDVGIYQDISGNHFAVMEETIYDGSRFYFLMSSDGQHKTEYESYMYKYSFLGMVQANNAKHLLRLLLELDMVYRSITFEDLRTYVWGFNLLSPVNQLNFKLELWN